MSCYAEVYYNCHELWWGQHKGWPSLVLGEHVCVCVLGEVCGGGAQPRNAGVYTRAQPTPYLHEGEGWGGALLLPIATTLGGPCHPLAWGTHRRVREASCLNTHFCCSFSGHFPPDSLMNFFPYQNNCYWINFPLWVFLEDIKLQSSLKKIICSSNDVRSLTAIFNPLYYMNHNIHNR